MKNNEKIPEVGKIYVVSDTAINRTNPEGYKPGDPILLIDLKPAVTSHLPTAMYRFTYINKQGLIKSIVAGTVWFFDQVDPCPIEEGF